jgi:hypothetical protein
MTSELTAGITARSEEEKVIYTMPIEVQVGREMAGDRHTTTNP